MNRFFSLLVLLLCCFWIPFVTLSASAQAVTIPIESAHTALVLRADTDKNLHIIYFGEKLSRPQEYNLAGPENLPGDYTGLLNSAYTPSGSRNLVEPALSVTHADGNASLDLRYVRHNVSAPKPNVTETRVFLKDPVYPFEVTLVYRVYVQEDVVEQWTEIRHNEAGPVTLHKYASANLYLKAGSYWLKQFHGDWAREMQPEETKITHGIKTLDSKLGTRADLFQPPTFMVSLDQPASEEDGVVLFGSLEWSGNYRIDLELDPLDNLRVIAGINNYASPYTLKPGESFITPPFMYTLSASGKGTASRRVHHWARNFKLLDGTGSRYTLLNNWEATYFDFDEARLKGLIRDAKNLGVDLFLLDDGWFGNMHPRNDDRAGLGDWQPNRKKLPNGISTLVQEATANGIKFGIWIEPEMVNPKSDLYQQHPDWVVKQPSRDEYYFRNQLVLDLSNPAVQDFVFNVVDKLLTENPGLAYFKWDCNAVIYNAHSTYQDNQAHFYTEYVRGLYAVLERIRAKYPDVPMMLCSGGGGRVDYGALQYFTEFWPSDNTDPMERIFIQWDYSYFYPAISTANHVTDWGRQPIKFRTDVAMMGKLGFDIVVSKLEPKDLEFSRNALKTYDAIKPIIWHGDQYRLSDPYKTDMASIQYVDSTQTSGVVFNYLVNNRYGRGSTRPIRLKGLDPARTYRVSEINLYPDTKSPINSETTYSGEFLMRVGINPEVRGGRNSVVLKIDAIDR